ncbi:ATP-dependent Clp protease adaptor ClpS [Ostreibacterium oceani]|uniref:ATP-dependent Clp protease adapter protein ClpS n=1 Tax=Ostreibacterium oceani TaxID=2654998 RepID=A0A6N7ESZ0_9GAMM|nr:ATP-dependent Clp protease adaptor ClpS [Ostreibacterium oceani]MPV85954.1 ATP-dependent Clp protease adaptor ClpS [Ostreibacterium oceani]
MSKNAQTDNQSLVLFERKQAVETPALYHVVLLNDDYTPMDFVIEVLMVLFKKSYQQAHEITMQVHQHERGIAGTYPKEIAVEKMTQVTLSAKANEFPLRCITERA